MYSLPSTSKMCPPLPWVMKTGYSPTTKLYGRRMPPTPPGVRRWASSSIAIDLVSVELRGALDVSWGSSATPSCGECRLGGACAAAVDMPCDGDGARCGAPRWRLNYAGLRPDSAARTGGRRGGRRRAAIMPGSVSRRQRDDVQPALTAAPAPRGSRAPPSRRTDRRATPATMISDAAEQRHGPGPLADQQQRVERRADRLEVAEDRRVLHAHATHALGPQRVGEGGADDAEDQADERGRVSSAGSRRRPSARAPGAAGSRRRAPTRRSRSRRRRRRGWSGS